VQDERRPRRHEPDQVGEAASPYPYGEVRSATVRWFVECYTVLALIAVVLTSGWIGYDIGQRTITAFGVEMPVDTKAPEAKAPDVNKKAPVTAKTPKEEIVLPLP
jgi:hypothetical protein